MSSTRSVKSPGIFAGDALTTIPAVPVQGVSYRDALAGAANVRAGWPFGIKVNSAEWNQIMWQLSSLLGILDSQGVLGWTNLVDYVPGAVAIGSDGGMYTAIRANGPATSVQDPISAPTYWTSTQARPVTAQRNLAATLATAGPAVTFTADSLTVAAGNTGAVYTIPNFSATFSTAVSGAGGIDTGSITAGGTVAIYAIFNPTTGVSALLGRNIVSGVAGDYYGGANMPSGFTASALLMTWRMVPASSVNLLAGIVRGRKLSTPGLAGPTTTTSTGTLTPFSLTSVPANAKRVTGHVTAQSTAAGNLGYAVAADAAGTGLQNCNTDSTRVTGNFQLDLALPQTIYFSTSGTGSASFGCTITGYEI